MTEGCSQTQKTAKFLKIFLKRHVFTAEKAKSYRLPFGITLLMGSWRKKDWSDRSDVSDKSDSKSSFFKRSLVQFVEKGAGSHIKWEFVGGGGVPVESLKVFCGLIGGLVEDEPSVGGWKV